MTNQIIIEDTVTVYRSILGWLAFTKDEEAYGSSRIDAIRKLADAYDADGNAIFWNIEE